jgi:hypothetical protein
VGVDAVREDVVSERAVPGEVGERAVSREVEVHDVGADRGEEGDDCVVGGA